MTAIRNQRIGSSYLQGVLADSTAGYLPRNAVNRLLHTGGSPFRILHGYGTVPFGFHYLVHPAYTYEGPGGGAFDGEQRAAAAGELGPVPRAGMSLQHEPADVAPMRIPDAALVSNEASQEMERLGLSRSVAVSAAVPATPPSPASPGLLPAHESVAHQPSVSAPSPPAQQRSSFLAELSRKLEAHNFSAGAAATQTGARASMLCPLEVTPRVPAARGSTSVHRAAGIPDDTSPIHQVSVPEPVKRTVPSQSSPAARATLPTIEAARLQESQPAALQMRIPDSPAGPLQRVTPPVMPTVPAALAASTTPQPISTIPPTQRAQIKRDVQKSAQQAAPTPSGIAPRRHEPALRERHVLIHEVVPARRQSIAFLERSQLAHAGLRLYK